jgi:hypothetical protein
MKIVCKSSPKPCISTKAEWEQAFIQKEGSKKHWKEGHSAESLAQYFTSPDVDNSNGIAMLRSILSYIGYDDVTLVQAEIEHESKFDHYRNGRMQDLFVTACANEKIIPICIEAKVNEEFGGTVSKTYKAAAKTLEKKPSSKQKQRIIDLLERYYALNISEETLTDESGLGQLQYQLVCTLAGSLSEVSPSNEVIIPIFVFHTPVYRKEVGQKNREHYHTFMQSLNFKKQDSESLPHSEVFVNENIEGVKVWSFYIDIMEGE